MKKRKPESRKSIRAEIRAARRGIPDHYRQQASYKVSTLISELPEYQAAERVAGFLPFDGEADPVPLLERAMQDGKQVYLPVLIAKGEPMKFAPYTKQTTLKNNWLGIGEPDVPQDQRIDPQELDFVVTPLVAFDESCNRIGVGGGFYDRSFAFVKTDQDSGTCLIGLAFEMQKLDSIKAQDWDVPLHGVVTEMVVYRK